MQFSVSDCQSLYILIPRKFQEFGLLGFYFRVANKLLFVVSFWNLVTASMQITSTCSTLRYPSISKHSGFLPPPPLHPHSTPHHKTKGLFSFKVWLLLWNFYLVPSNQYSATSHRKLDEWNPKNKDFSFYSNRSSVESN